MTLSDSTVNNINVNAHVLTFTVWEPPTPLLIRLALPIFVSDQFVATIAFKIDSASECKDVGLQLTILRASRVSTTSCWAREYNSAHLSYFQ